jgi:hypothetical protein
MDLLSLINPELALHGQIMDYLMLNRFVSYISFHLCNWFCNYTIFNIHN